jgi:hypothetical protein
VNTSHLAHLVGGAMLVLAAHSVATAEQRGSASSSPTLVDVVLSATDRFRDPNEALASGYTQMPACVSGPEAGAMGVHFVDFNLVGDGELDAEHPEALVYEARNGRFRLVAVEYIVIAEAWHANHAAPPTLMGQQFNYIGSPNRYGNPPFYELHVWAWKPNPNGMFVDWNTKVSCEEHTTDGPTHSLGH